jgi:hypothetical protein
MATEWQLEKMAEESRHATYKDFKGNRGKDSNVEAPKIIIYKGYDEHYCPQCSGNVIYPAEWEQCEGMCLNCCQGFLYMPDTEKPKQPITHRPVIKLNFKVGMGRDDNAK